MHSERSFPSFFVEPSETYSNKYEESQYCQACAILDVIDERHKFPTCLRLAQFIFVRKRRKPERISIH